MKATGGRSDTAGEEDTQARAGAQARSAGHVTTGAQARAFKPLRPHQILRQVRALDGLDMGRGADTGACSDGRIASGIATASDGRGLASARARKVSFLAGDCLPSAGQYRPHPGSPHTVSRGCLPPHSASEGSSGTSVAKTDERRCTVPPASSCDGVVSGAIAAERRQRGGTASEGRGPVSASRPEFFSLAGESILGAVCWGSAALAIGDEVAS